MNNKDIRKAIDDAGLKHWQVAEAYRLHESNFSRLLRRELDSQKKEMVFEAIAKAKEESRTNNPMNDVNVRL